jgi:UDP-N-acetyl-D-mannosaminuronic acid transferase (WecB/TagA/CpsF family)
MARRKDDMPNIKIFMAIGAMINIEAGVVSRSPRWMSNSGLGWLYRLCAEPKRLWKRYLLDDPRFLWLVLMQKLNLYEPPIQEIDSYHSEEVGNAMVP